MLSCCPQSGCELGRNLQSASVNPMKLKKKLIVNVHQLLVDLKHTTKKESGE